MSKSPLVLFALLFVFQNTYAQKQQPVPSKIEKVTAFLRGAQVFRKGKTNLPAGKTELVFKEISPNLDKGSIQVKGEGAFTILSVIHQQNYLEEQARREEITKLEVEKRRISEDKQLQNAMLAVYKQEEAMLQKNQAIGGQNTGVKTADLREAVDFQRQRMTEVLTKQIETQRRLAQMDSSVLKLDKQLSALNRKKDLSTSEVLVTVSAKTATDAVFEISYYVRDAGWFANYDLRVKDVSSPIDLSMKANVFQSSGEDWKDVRLTLSNGDPTLSGVAGELSPWYLRFGYSAPKAYNGGVGRGGFTEVRGKVYDAATGEPLIGATILVVGSSTGTVTDIDGTYSLKIPVTATTLSINYTGYANQEVPINSASINVPLTTGALLQEVVVTGYGGSTGFLDKFKRSKGDFSGAVPTIETYQPTTINFEIELPYTILNDGKTYTVDIKSQPVAAQYEYFTAPKLDENAYLTAHIANWQDLNLLDGEANLFFEGAFLGKSLLDVHNAGDTLDISLGQDKGVLVRRTKLKEFTSRQFLGNNKTERRAFTILVKNNKQQAVDITVQDQFPISTDKSIEVGDLKYDGAELEKETQILTWKLTLAPKEERTLELRYSVKYPKRQVLVLE